MRNFSYLIYALFVIFILLVITLYPDIVKRIKTMDIDKSSLKVIKNDSIWIDSSVTDTANYKKVTFQNLLKNPLFYDGKKIEIEGKFSAISESFFGIIPKLDEEKLAKYLLDTNKLPKIKNRSRNVYIGITTSFTRNATKMDIDLLQQHQDLKMRGIFWIYGYSSINCFGRLDSIYYVSKVK